MTKKLTHWLAAILAAFIALMALWGAVGGIGKLSASAAEDFEPTYPQSGWYELGNGASQGSLGACSWTEYLPDFRLTGTSADDPTAEYQNYLGRWQTKELLLYNNDQFKFLYESGKWEYPNDSGWGADIVADYYSLTGDAEGNFTDGGLGNIQVSATGSGYYIFTLVVERDTTSPLGVKLALTYEKTEPVDPIQEYRMYVVGKVASVPACGWPTEDGKDATLLYMVERWVKETDEETGETFIVKKYYSERIFFTTSDQIKVYNAADGHYYPGGVNNNQAPATNGWYYVEWKQDAPNLKFVTELPKAYPIPAPGWYLVGNGAGTLYDCSWTEYLSDYRIGGTAFDGSTEKDYLGFWKTESLLLYQGDQFKFLYQNGKWATPDASGWSSCYTAGFADLSANNSGDAFSSVGEDIIQVNKSGYYTFYIHVAKAASGVAITLTFNLMSTSVPSKTLEDMYIVGSVASVPACGWPDEVNVTSSCIKMAYNSYDNKWYSPAIRLTAADEIKVYNLANHGYYPSFFDDNFSVATSGWYIIQWESGSQTLTAIPVPNDFAS